MLLLRHFGIEIHSHVLSIGQVGDRHSELSALGQQFTADYWQAVESSAVRCGDSALSAAMVAWIQECKARAETCGGVFEVVATGVPIGLGSFSMWDRRLSSRIAGAMMSIPSAKGVEIGSGFLSSSQYGSQVHDVIRRNEHNEWQRLSNNAGGIEGGISNGEPIVVRVGVKPIASLAHPLPTVDIRSGQNVAEGRYERSDVCVVPAAGVVGEAMLAIVVAEAWVEKFGGDSLAEMQTNVEAYRARTRPQ
jgi:chorismate synthase